MDNYLIDPETGCWLWQGYRDPTGYPYHLINGRNISARRSHYEQRHGPIPKGLKPLPRCHNRLCVHPDHAAPVSQRTIARQVSATRLDAAMVHSIRELAGQMTQRVIAEQRGVSEANVSNVLTGKAWVDETATPPPAYERHYGKLSFADAERIRELAQTMKKKDVAAMYGVSLSAISLIVSGKRWAKPHVSTVGKAEAAPSEPEPDRGEQ